MLLAPNVQASVHKNAAGGRPAQKASRLPALRRVRADVRQGRPRAGKPPFRGRARPMVAAARARTGSALARGWFLTAAAVPKTFSLLGSKEQSHAPG